MTKKLTITVSDEVYDGLHGRIGRRRISCFIDELAREHVVGNPQARRADPDAQYREMAADQERDKEAKIWDDLTGDALEDEDFSAWPGYPAR